MIDRTFIKDEAKKLLRDNFVKAIVLCIILNVLVGNYTENYKFNIKIDSSKNYIEENELNSALNKDGYKISLDKNLDKSFIDTENEEFVNRPLFSRLKSGFVILLAPIVFLSIVLIRVLITTFMLPVSLGANKAFLDVYKTGEELDLRKLFYYFKSGYYGKIIINIILKNTVIVLYTLLLIIPGVIKSYQYYFIDYILSDDPSLSFSDAKEISKQMTNGIKWDLFIFDLSFSGWILLSIGTLGLGFFILTPYIEAATARLYLQVMENKRKVLAEYI